MKFLVLTSALLYLASVSHAATTDTDFADTVVSDDQVSNGLAMLGDAAARFISANEDGLQLSFNSTSLQYLALFGIPLLLVALVALPLFGISLGSLFPWKKAPINGYGDYDYDSSYTHYNHAARSLERFTPIVSIIQDAYKKYQDLQ